MKPTVEILVGMIASGKSTYARKRAATGAVIVNDDAVVLAVHGGDYTLYDKALKPLYKSTEYQIASTALAMGRDVVIDRGVNVSRAARRRWLALAESLDLPVEATVFPNMGHMEHARRRAAADPRGQNVEWWRQAAMRHESEWEVPTQEEGFDSVTWEV